MTGQDAPIDRVVAALKQGDSDAWHQTYASLAPAIIGYLTARGVADAEDLASEVFLDLARKIGSFEGDMSALRGWAFTMAHSRWVDEIRRTHRRERKAYSLDAPDVVASAETDALERIGQQELIGAMRSLTELQRTVVLLRIFGDLTHAEIADAIGRSPAAVRVDYHRAISRLRADLAPEPERAHRDPATGFGGVTK